jgi:hypothetical protein
MTERTTMREGLTSVVQGAHPNVDVAPIVETILRHMGINPDAPYTPPAQNLRAVLGLR